LALRHDMQPGARLSLNEDDLAACHAPLRRSQRKLVKKIIRQRGKIRHASQGFATRRRSIGHVSPSSKSEASQIPVQRK
jgi:hypothetical protein